MRKKLLISVLIIPLLLSFAFISQAADRRVKNITFLSSGAVTAATAQSSSFNISAYNEGHIYVYVTVESGTSTLYIIIQTSPDDSEWYTHTTISQISATGNTLEKITNMGEYMRIYYTVGGTSMTFSVKGVFKN